MIDRPNIKIVLVAFCDHEQHSVWYKVTTSIDEAAKYYAVMLSKPNVHVISTRVISNSTNKP